jgi:hypothetical protein
MNARKLYNLGGKSASSMKPCSMKTQHGFLKQEKSSFDLIKIPLRKSASLERFFGRKKI